MTPAELDARIDAACGDDPLAAGTARRRLGWLASLPGAGVFRPRRLDPRQRVPRRQGLTPDRALLDAMTAHGLLRRAGRGHAFADEAVRARLAELWRRGPGALTMLPAATRLDSGRVTGQGPRPAPGNTVEFLVDNAAAWGRLADEIAAATTSVRGLLFMLDVPHVRLGFTGDPAASPAPTGGARLEELLLGAAGRGAAVHLVLNHVTPAFSPANTTHPVERFFRTRDPGGRVKLRRLRTPQTVPIHGKVFVIDDRVAYLIGSVFAQEYFDGREHLIDDPRRGHLRWRSSVRAPVHDVSVRIEGPAVADLDRTVRLHWDHCRARPGDAMPPFRPVSRTPKAPRPASGTTLQVTRTLHGARRYAGLPAGETGIHESYLRALATAERFVYLENQYFTCPEMADVLAETAARGVQLIMLINIRPDVPHYIGWQAAALERLLRRAGPGRVGVYTLWSHEKGAGRTRILRTHVHSKVAIVDDTWLTIGSANLDGVSLTASDHELRRPLPVRLVRLAGGSAGGDPWQARATEVNIGCADADAAGRLRRELWAEHLGYPAPGDPALAEPPAAGWAALWRERAERKLAGLREPDPTVHDARILPYPLGGDGAPARNAHDPAGHLRALGVRPELIEVHTRFRSFDFRTGRWRS